MKIMDNSPSCGFHLRVANDVNVKSFTAQTDLYCFVTYLLSCESQKPFTIYIKKEPMIRIDLSMVLFLSVNLVRLHAIHGFPHLNCWCVLL